jgi:hypothetical protein
MDISCMSDDKKNAISYPVRYVIGSGWWCSASDDRNINPSRKLLGDDKIRDVEFFDIWLGSIRNVACPEKIVVIDSNSPVKPEIRLRKAVSWVELPLNAKHSTNHTGQWSGWMRSVLLGGHYALVSDAEYFVYVEQDCLLAGEGIIEHCIAGMTTDFMFGSGDGTPQPIQQSFFIIRRRALARFLHNLVRLNKTDRDLPPEWKFVFSTWSGFVLASNLGLLRWHFTRSIVKYISKRIFYDELPIGSGRARPLPKTERYFYFQHGTSEDIAFFSSTSGNVNGGE